MTLVTVEVEKYGGSLTEFCIFVLIPLCEVHVKKLEAVKSGWVPHELCTSIASRKDSFTYLQILDTKAYNVEGVGVELAPLVMCKAVERWHTETKLLLCRCHRYGTLLYSCIEWASNVIPETQAPAEDLKEFVDNGQTILSTVRSLVAIGRLDIYTHSSPLRIISQNIQIRPWRQAARNIPDSRYIFHIRLKISAAAAFHLSVQVVCSTSPSAAPTSSVVLTDASLAF